MSPGARAWPGNPVAPRGRAPRMRYHPSRMLRLALALSVLAACEPPRPARDTVVRRFTSPDGRTWTLDPTPPMTQFESLGLAPGADGAWRVSGIDWSEEPPWWERFFPAHVDGFVGGGTAWTRVEWTVDIGDSPAAIDPQWFGEQLWFIARKGKGGDPALMRVPNEMWVTGEARPRASGVGLADPMPIEVGGRLVVFATVWGRGVVQLEGDPLAEVRVFQGYTVPYAFVEDGVVTLLVQGVVRGKRAPLRMISTDGARTWSAPAAVVPMDGVQSCTSPVMGRTGAERFLLCVDEGS